MSEPTAAAPAPLRICERCKLPMRPQKEHDFEADCIAAQRRAMALLMEKIGKPRACKGCGQTIYMVTIATGEVKPMDPSGWTHFQTCPAAADFYARKQGEAAAR